MPKKTVCPVTRSEFRSQAPQAIPVTIAAHPVGGAIAKEFKTGSLGWHATGKIQITINGKPCQVSVNLLLTLDGSKEATP